MVSQLRGLIEQFKIDRKTTSAVNGPMAMGAAG